MRRLSWLVILFQFFWLNVIVPGHVRGKLTVTGSAPAAAGSCCTSAAHKTPGKPQQPTPDQQQRCAVCYVAAGHTLPPVYNFDLRLTGNVWTPIPEVVEKKPIAAFPRTYDANAPPILPLV